MCLFLGSQLVQEVTFSFSDSFLIMTTMKEIFTLFYFQKLFLLGFLSTISFFLIWTLKEKQVDYLSHFYVLFLSGLQSYRFRKKITRKSSWKEWNQKRLKNKTFKSSFTDLFICLFILKQTIKKIIFQPLSKYSLQNSKTLHQILQL